MARRKFEWRCSNCLKLQTIEFDWPDHVPLPLPGELEARAGHCESCRAKAREGYAQDRLCEPHATPKQIVKLVMAIPAQWPDWPFMRVKRLASTKPRVIEYGTVVEGAFNRVYLVRYDPKRFKHTPLQGEVPYRFYPTPEAFFDAGWQPDDE
jgi:hypothetical protein